VPPNAPHAPDPTNCGVDNTHFPEACLNTPLSAQEAALEYMFFDLTACVTPDQGTPGTPGNPLVSETFSLDFTGTCPAGSRVTWREFDVQVGMPSSGTGASIAFAAQTGMPGADASTYLPSTPLALWTATTNTSLPNYDVMLLDTAPGGSGKFTLATPPVVSSDDLRVFVTMNPTSDGQASPTLMGWYAQYDCHATE
jgi:hypothetical protein